MEPTDEDKLFKAFCRGDPILLVPAPGRYLEGKIDYTGKSCAYRFGHSLMQGAFLGLVSGCAVLGWYPDPYRFDVKGKVVPIALDFKYVLTGIRPYVVQMSIVCSAFAGVECLMERLREQEESTYPNAAAAGAVAGAILASASKRFDITGISALAMGAFMASIDFNMQYNKTDPERMKNQTLLALPPESESEALQALKKRYPEFKHM